jgi:PAS domain S-box-containing protein
LESLFIRKYKNHLDPYQHPGKDNFGLELQILENDLLAKCKDGKLKQVIVRIVYSKYSKKYAFAYMSLTTEQFLNKEHMNISSFLFHESLNDFYIISADSFRFSNANAGALHRIGYSLEEVRLLTPWDLNHDHDKHKFIHYANQVISGKERKVVFESVFKCKDASTFPVEIHLQLLEDAVQKVLIATVLDLSEKKRAERDQLKTILQAQKLEKERIARDLHDDLGQHLTAIQVNLYTLEKCYNNPSTVNPSEVFAKINLILKDTIIGLKSISLDLAPRVLMDYGLVNALQYLCDSFNSPHLQVNLQVDNIHLVVETTHGLAVYRIAQELINNAVKHGDAKEVKVQFIKTDNSLSLTVADDGIGFEINKTLNKTGQGIRNIKSRVRELNGNFSIESKLGYGSTASVEILF